MKYNRSKLFVDPGFQGRLLLRLVVYWVVYHVALWHLLFLFTLFSHTMSTESASPPKSLGALYGEFARNNVSIVICFFVMLPILGRDLLRFSHRLAGPLVRFRNTLGEMAQDKPVAPVTLRNFDLPTDFLNTFNSVVTVWNGKFDRQAQPLDDTEQELVESGI